MEYKALYRKYRPNSFSEIVGQDPVVKTFINSIKEKKISHAYLLCGPRGTGKTSLAKLIAKAINCLEPVEGEACNDCKMCNTINQNLTQDIMEIDAASNNGVDEIREIRNKINYVPSDCKYKVYIVDEVHMLSTSAFNALLKTLEEPPKHIIFILATTESQKVPLTIISRCQRFDLKKISLNNIKEKLSHIVKKEKVIVDEIALNEIARISDGGLRDAIGILDQVISYKSNNITVEDVFFINGGISKDEIYNLVYHLLTKEIKEALDNLEYFDEAGKDFGKLCEDIIVFLKNIILYSYIPSMFSNDDKTKFNNILQLASKNQLFKIIDNINSTIQDMNNVSNLKLSFELLLLKIVSIDNDIEPLNDVKTIASKNLPVSLKKNKEIISIIAKEEVKQIIDKNKKELNKQISHKIYDLAKIKDVRINNALATADKSKLSDMINKWNNLREFNIDQNYSYVASLLLDSQLRIVGKEIIIISFPYSSMVDHCNEQLIPAELLIEKAFNFKCKMFSILDSEWDQIKTKYIADKKNHITYEILEEDLDKYIEIAKEEDKDKEINDVVELFGKNIVEIK